MTDNMIIGLCLAFIILTLGFGDLLGAGVTYVLRKVRG